MKKTLLILSAFLISMTVFAQKDELKAADKAIGNNDFATAIAEINNAESLIADADQKTKAKFYYLKALATYQNGSEKADIMEVSTAFNELINYEKESGKVKYTNEVGELLNNLISSTAAKASNDYKEAIVSLEDEDYAKAAKGFYTVYMLSPKDTSFLDNAALLYSKAKKYETSNKLYNELLDLNYTGISTEYIATNKDDGEDVYFADEKAMNVQVKLGIVENPRNQVKESRRRMIFSNMSENYVQLDDLDKAIEILNTAREEFPESFELLITQANVHFKNEENDEFKLLLEEAVKIKPNDPNLYYNLGVMNMDQKDIEEAIKNFEKAIELNPEMAAAYQNIGTAIIEKTLPLVEEMNKSLSDFDKYDRLIGEQKEIYKEALPYYEKAYELDNSNIGVVQTLLGLYENLEMTEKLEEIKVVYDSLRE